MAGRVTKTPARSSARPKPEASSASAESASRPAPPRPATRTSTARAKADAKAQSKPAPKRGDTPKGSRAARAPEPPPQGARTTGRARRASAEVTRAAENRGKYVYCIIHASDTLRFGPIGIGVEPSDVHTVNYRDIGAVVSDTPIEVHDPTRENVLAHERVNETVMRKHTVIPMSFGTVFKTRDDIVELLRSAYDAFHDVLAKMKDKLEFGLKVLWDRDVMLREIENDEEEVRRLKSEISSQRGSTYFARMQYGRLVDAALVSRSERYTADIFARLRDVAVASRSNKPIGDRMIMNAAFLISRDNEAAFDARIKEIGARYDKLTFKYSGPWPPYNFVNIRLKLERARGKE